MKRLSPALAAGLTALVWMGFNLLLLARFPTVHLDETVNANHALNLALHHQALFSLYDGLYPPALYELRHAWVEVIRPFYLYPLAGLIKGFGFSFVKARFLSLLAGFLSLLAIYQVGCSLGNPRLGYVALLLLSTRFVFLYCSDRIRPEMMLCFCGLLVFMGLLKTLKTSSLIAPLFTGLLSGLAAGVHTNGLLFMIPVMVLIAIRKKWLSLGVCALGGAVGLSAFLAAADWEHFLPGTKVLFFNEFASPSIMKVHGNVFLAIASEWTRYFGGWIFYDWPGGWLYHMLSGWQYILYAAAVCMVISRKDEQRTPAQFVSILAGCYCLFTGNKAYPYLSVLEPYFILCLSIWFLSSPMPSPSSLASSVCVLMMALPLGKIPALFIVSLSVLPKKTFEVGLLILLTSLLMEGAQLRNWVLQALVDFKRLWPLTVGAALVYGVLHVKTSIPRLKPSSLSLGWAVLGLTTLGNLVFVGAIAAYQPSFDNLCQTLSQKMLPGARVVGPQSLWLGLTAYDYRDMGGLEWYRLLMGENNLVQPLGNFKPDYIIADEAFIQQLSRLNRQRHARDLQNPTGLFPWPHQVLGVFDVGRVYGSQLVLIRNDWPRNNGKP